MLSFLSLIFILVGVMLLLPGITKQRSDWMGLRFAMSSVSIITALYLSNVVLRIPLSVVAWGIAGISMIGFIVGFIVLVKSRLSNDFKALEICIHPLIVLSLVGFIVLLFSEKVDYQPYLGDEFASWLKITRQIFLANDYWSDKVEYHLGAYTNGWPLFVALPNLFFDSYQESRTVAVQFLMHLGVLAFTYDCLKWIYSRYQSTNRFSASLFAWLGVTTLLISEASWKVWPTDLLIDRPLLYMLLIIFLLGMISLYDGIIKSRIAVLIGLSMGAGYLIKVSILSVGPTLGLFWLILKKSTFSSQFISSGKKDSNWTKPLKRGLVFGLAMIGPLAFVYISWSLRKFGVSPLATASTFLQGDFSLLFSPAGLDVLWRMGVGFSQYLQLFKLPLTALSVVIIIAAFFTRRFSILIGGIIIFFIIYVAALYVSYVFWQGALTREDLESFPRFVRVVLRIIHYFGITLLFIFIAKIFTQKSVDFVGLKQRFFNKPTSQSFGITLVIIGIIYQASSMFRSVDDMSTRSLQSPALITHLSKIKKDSDNLKILILKENIKPSPTVAVIEQGGIGVARDAARYFSIKSKRDSNYFDYKVTTAFKWSWGTDADKAGLISHFRNHDVIWPVVTDPYIESVILEVVDDSDCWTEPVRYFLVRGNSSVFRCLLKTR